MVLLVIFFAWAGRSLGRAFKLPSSSKLLVILAVLAAVVGFVLATRPGRRFAARKLLPVTRSSVANLRRVATEPGQAGLAVRRLGPGDPGLYRRPGGLGRRPSGRARASPRSARSTWCLADRRRLPHPGRPGRLEAALIAGLTGIGISSGAAVSAVLTYRLATYWLPVLPGWYSWRLLQRMDYL